MAPPVTDPATAFGGLKSTSPYIEIAAGASGGFLVGFVFFKFSKLLAVCAGGAILAAEVAVQAGIIKIDTERLLGDPPSPAVAQSNVQSALARFEGQSNIIDNAKEAILSSTRLATAFLGGILLGFGFS